MKIDNNIAQQAYAAYRNTAGTARATGSGQQREDAAAVKVQKSDSASISAGGRLRAQALDAVRSTPEVRANLVSELRAQIQSGTYTIDDHALAQHIAHRGDITS